MIPRGQPGVSCLDLQPGPRATTLARIRLIVREEFDRFEPFRAPEAERIFEEVEWFADVDGLVIGVLARDREDNDWAYVILGRDERGAFRAFENEVGFGARDEARQQLIGIMEHIAAAGTKVFPQGD